MTPKKLSRRDAIKLLGAAAGATLLANLPSKWKTPELASGMLPAHAQTSGLFFVNGGFIRVRQDASNPSFETPNGGLQLVSALRNPDCTFIGRHWVEISQKIKDIPLVLVVTPDPASSITWTTPPPAAGANGTHLTDANGKVEINIEYQSSPTKPVKFSWSFQNPLQGTGAIDFLNNCSPIV